MGWGGEGRGGERRGGNMHKSTPLAGDLHLREIMRQLYYMGEVSSPGVGMGWEGWGSKGWGWEGRRGDVHQPP